MTWIVVALLALPFAPAADPPNPYGVCAHLPRGDEYATAERELQQMRRMGIGWVRSDFSWGGVQHKKGGPWQFDHTDKVLDWAEANGVTVLPILNYSVPWANPAHEHLDEWTAYVRAVVGRYHKRLRYWEVWNEQNIKQFWPKPDAVAYGKLLKVTYDAIKAIDRDLVVVYGGTAGIPWDYLEASYKAGAGKLCDVMNVHPYSWPAPPEGALYNHLTTLRERMTKHGDGKKPIWITEIGWPTHEGKRTVSEERQAELIARAYILALHAGVERVFWYEFACMENRADDPEGHFGIVRKDLREKPAAKALATLITLRPPGSVRLDGDFRARHDGKGLHFPGWKRPDGKTVFAVWSNGEKRPAAVRVRGTVEQVVDLSGRVVTVKADGDRLALPVGERVLYVVGPTAVRGD